MRSMSHHEILSVVNQVIFATTGEFTIDELAEKVIAKMPSDVSDIDIAYAKELVKGTVCRFVLRNAIKKGENGRYKMPG